MNICRERGKKKFKKMNKNENKNENKNNIQEIKTEFA